MKASTAVVVLALLGLATASALTSWPQVGVDPQQTSHVDVDLPVTPIAAWQHYIGSALSGAAVSTDNVVYVGDDTGSLWAIAQPNRNWMTAIPMWSFQPSVMWEYKAYPSKNSVGITTAVCLSKDESMVYAGYTDSTVRAVDTKSAKMIWNRNFASAQGVTTPLVIYKNVLLFGTTDGSIFALNATTGMNMWTANSGSVVRGALSVDPATDTVFWTSGDTYLYAVGLADGAPTSLDHTNIDGVNPLSTTAAVDSAMGVLMVTVDATPGDPGGLFSVSLNDGTITSLLPTTGSAHSSPAIIPGKCVAFSTDDGRVACVDATTKTTTWSRSFGTDSVRSGPVACNATVYVGSADGTIAVLDSSTGGEKWSMALKSGVVAPPAVTAHGDIIVGTLDGTLISVADSGSSSFMALIVLIVIGVIALWELVLGYRCFEVTMLLMGVVIAMPSGLAVFVMAFNENPFDAWWSSGILVGAGLVLGFLTWIARPVAPCVLALFTGAAAASVAVVFGDPSVVKLPLYCAIGGGVLALLLMLMQIAKNLKKFVCLCGISLMFASILVRVVVAIANTSALTPPIQAGAIGGLMVCSMIMQACCTGRGQHHLSRKQQRKQREEADMPVMGTIAEPLLPTVDMSPQGGRAAAHSNASVGGAGAGAGVAAGTGSVNGGSAVMTPTPELLMSMTMPGADHNFAGNNDSDPEAAVLPGQRAGIAYNAKGSTNIAAADNVSQTVAATFGEGKLGLRMEQAPAGSCSVAVVTVSSGMAAEQGIQAGDYLVEIQGAPVSSSSEYGKVMRTLATSKRPMQLLFRRMHPAATAPPAEDNHGWFQWGN